MSHCVDYPPLPSKPHKDEADTSRAEASGKSPAQGGWGRLAAQIAQWTTRGILCAIVLVACVGFGRQVLQWWYENTPEHGKSTLSLDPLNGLGEQDRLHVFRFPDLPWEFRRQVVVGDTKRALDLLKSECAQATANCHTLLPLSGPEEKRFLETLRDRSPLAQGVGWAVYGFQESIPLVVGVRENVYVGKCPSIEGKFSPIKNVQNPFSPGNSSVLHSPPVRVNHAPDKPAQPIQNLPLDSISTPSELAPSGQSVVCWGFGIPHGVEKWTLYILVAIQPTNLIDLEEGDRIPIPPETHLLYSLGVVRGPRLILFRGPPRPETWKSFYETFFRTHGGQQLGCWVQLANRWRGRFQWLSQTQTAGSKSSESPKIVEIYFGPDTSDTWNGLIWIWAQGATVP
ncbi:MAG: hypothetical protein NZ602_14975 [Thermoguttaceae bacterium]|nr:hypothetical protein [Thermoguttaceae bacterium]MDW8037469.1 hypothetical protein [Thermoguttaceae bacterium]